MKIAFITDLHFGVRNDSSIFLEHFQNFYSNVFFHYLIENDIKDCIILGDVFDRRKYTNHKIIKAIRDILFDPLADYGINVKVLVGNHDSTFKNSIELNTLDLLLSHYLNVEIIERPIDIIVNGMAMFCAIPWICQDNYDESIRLIERTKSPILLGHLELSGFEFHRGQVSKEGFDPSLFKKFDHVFSGHYHHRSTRGNITYLGTPYEMTWHDYNDPKGFHIFDTGTFNLEFIENPIKLFIRLEYDDTKDIDFNQLSSMDLKNKFIKLIVTNKTDYYKFDQYVQILYQKECADINIIENLNDMLSSINSDGELIDTEINLEDTQSILLNYIDNMNLDIDKEDLKTFVKNLYLEALIEEPS